jgi:hypothetical protein
VRLSNGYSLLNHVNAVATAWGLHPGPFFLAQQRAKLVAVVAVVAVMTVAAADGVFGWHQVTDFNANFGFLCSHVIKFPFIILAFVNSRLENSFLAVH